MDTPTFLLTYLQIQELLTKLYSNFDTHQPQKLRAEVFAPSIHVDYTALFGGEASQRTNEELVAIWTGLMEKLETSQHLVTGILPELTPENLVDGPVNVSANVTAYLRKKGGDGRVLETRNGGRLEVEVVRVEGDVGGGIGNPWRISKLQASKTVKGWDEGGKEFWAA